MVPIPSSYAGFCIHHSLLSQTTKKATDLDAQATRLPT